LKESLGKSEKETRVKVKKKGKLTESLGGRQEGGSDEDRILHSAWARQNRH